MGKHVTHQWVWGPIENITHLNDFQVYFCIESFPATTKNHQKSKCHNEFSILVATVFATTEQTMEMWCGKQHANLDKGEKKEQSKYTFKHGKNPFLLKR